ncbi:MAG: hypothetical protein JW870_20150 [Candidatus Delongbacteria bacterium]|nr:hypothetical protein [Candidatus Delongbacteria bacterium]
MSLNEERTQNILKVYQYLHKKKLVEDKADFCRQIGLTTTQFGRIQAGEDYFPDDNERKLVGVFHVNVNFIYHGRGKMIWANNPVRQIGVVDKAVKKDKKKLLGKFRSLENTDGDIDLNMN